MALPVYTMRGDLTGTVFGGTPTWSDYTAYVITGPDGAPVDIVGGRQDNRADVPPARMTFILNNTDGRFTTGASLVELDHLFNFRIVANATTYDLYTGYVTSVEPTWPGGVQNWSIIRVSCVDAAGKVDQGRRPLSAFVIEDMLDDTPAFLYPLTEDTASRSAGDVSGNNNLALTRLDSKYGPGVLDFGQTLGVAEDVTGARFTPSGSPAKGSALYGPGPAQMPTSGGMSIEAWIVGSSTSTASSWVGLIDGDSSTLGFATTAPDTVNGDLSLYVQSPAGLVFPFPRVPFSVFDDTLHHIVGVLETDGVTVNLYADRELVDTATAGAPLSFNPWTTMSIGGIADSKLNVGLTFSGLIGLFAGYGQALTAAEIADRYDIGIGALTETNSARFSRIAGYGNAPVTLPASIGNSGPQKTSGGSVAGELQKVARSEGTFAYTTGAGNVTFQARSIRYDKTAALALTGDDIAPDLPIRKDLQDFFNQLVVQRDGGSDQRIIDLASQATKSGIADGGSYTIATDTDDDAYQNGSWQVALHSQPRVRFPSLKVDLLSRDAAFQASVLALGPSSLVSLSSLPSQAPSSAPSLFIEGWHYTVSAQAYDVEFFTSQQTLENEVLKVIAAGTDTQAAVDGTMRVGF